jgi:hypothetical protein
VPNLFWSYNHQPPQDLLLLLLLLQLHLYINL